MFSVTDLFLKAIQSIFACNCKTSYSTYKIYKNFESLIPINLFYFLMVSCVQVNIDNTYAHKVHRVQYLNSMKTYNEQETGAVYFGSVGYGQEKQIHNKITQKEQRKAIEVGLQMLNNLHLLSCWFGSFLHFQHLSLSCMHREGQKQFYSYVKQNVFLYYYLLFSIQTTVNLLLPDPVYVMAVSQVSLYSN